MSANDDKEYNQSIHNKHAYGTKKDLVDIKEEVECKNIIKQYKNDELWLHYEKTEEHNPNWSIISDDLLE